MGEGLAGHVLDAKASPQNFNEAPSFDMAIFVVVFEMYREIQGRKAVVECMQLLGAAQLENLHVIMHHTMGRMRQAISDRCLGSSSVRDFKITAKCTSKYFLTRQKPEIS